MAACVVNAAKNHAQWQNVVMKGEWGQDPGNGEAQERLDDVLRQIAHSNGNRVLQALRHVPTHHVTPPPTLCPSFPLSHSM